MYLIRHGRIDAQGRCYGQTDLESAEPYELTANRLMPILPKTPEKVLTSPLKRCFQLSQALFPEMDVDIDARLMEVNFGAWENQSWDLINRTELDLWAKNPLDFQFPFGENLKQFERRVNDVWQTLTNLPESTCIVSHAGVIRILCACYLSQSWESWWNRPVPYASVFELKNGTIGQITTTNT